MYFSAIEVCCHFFVQCADVVKQYGPEVVNIIANAINAQALCKVRCQWCTVVGCQTTCAACKIDK